MRKSRLIKFKYMWFLILAIAAQAAAEDKKTEQAQIAQPQVPTKIQPLAENLAKIGAFSCAERANQIANFLTGNKQADLIFQTPKDNPNNRLLMSTMIIPNQNYQNAIGGVSLAPNQVNGCGGSYHLVFYTSKQCSNATAEIFPSVKFQPINKTNIQIGVVGRGYWILGMPAENGCVFIKEQIIE